MLRCRTSYLIGLIVLMAGLLGCRELHAQSTRVRGQVTDAATGEPLQFVSVVFPGTTVGITTDEQGIYSLETRDTVSRVEASMVGYVSCTQPVTPRQYNQVDFALEAAQFGIDNVVITPGENPALPILKGVIRNRSRNNPAEYERYSCATYTKMELDLTNIKPHFRNRRMQKNFGFIFDHIDTSALTGQPYLPAMISEAVADYYHSRQPALSREVIRGSRVSGVEDSFTVAQFTGQLQGDINFYDNFIALFNVRFASPLSSMGESFYNYFLVDSLEVDGRKTYKIRFHPKRLSTAVLDGEVNIDSATYALQSASARMPKGVNVNWINHLLLENENQLLDEGVWFRKRDKVSAEFSVTQADSSKLVSFIGTREVAYSDIRIGAPIPREVLRMDNDTTRGKDDLVRMLTTFRRGEAQVLIGTQMIAKGLDFPRVTLVGVVAADMTLNLPDYRAPERTFQLITQVAGRAGRAGLPGEGIAQTYKPEDPCIQAAAAQDYRTFFEQEFSRRRAGLYPPFTLLARLLVESPDEEAAHQTAERLYDVVRTYLLSHPVQKKRTLMLRADEAPVKRIRGQYRYHVLMKLFDHPDVSPLLALLAELAGVQDGACTIYCEVNPATMM